MHLSDRLDPRAEKQVHISILKVPFTNNSYKLTRYLIFL